MSLSCLLFSKDLLLSSKFSSFFFLWVLLAVFEISAKMRAVLTCREGGPSGMYSSPVPPVDQTSLPTIASRMLPCLFRPQMSIFTEARTSPPSCSPIRRTVPTRRAQARPSVADFFPSLNSPLSCSSKKTSSCSPIDQRFRKTGDPSFPTGFVRQFRFASLFLFLPLLSHNGPVPAFWVLTPPMKNIHFHLR